MPRIDPLQLLKCLSVLLSPTGGIKSKEEVQRLASLMTKFSKKLVSKCIYIQILKTTKTDLLGMFMAAGGWHLTHTWLSDAIVAKNWPLIQELLELLLMCPVDVERLKTNNCPKLIKGLSKESSNESVKLLASKLVEQWLKIVKGETEAVRAHQVAHVDNKTVEVARTENKVSTVDSVSVTVTVKEDRNQTEFTNERLSSHDNNEESRVDGVPSSVKPDSVVHVKTENLDPKVEVQKLIVKTEEKSDESGEEVASWEDTPSGQLPVYKITIRDGKQVLAKVFSGEKSNRKSSVDSSSGGTTTDNSKSLTKVSASVPKVSDSVIIKKEEIKTELEETVVKVNADSQKTAIVKTKLKSEKLDSNTESSKLTKDVSKKVKDSGKAYDKEKRLKVEKNKEKEVSREKSKDKPKDRESNKDRDNKNKDNKDKKLNAEKLNAQFEKDKAALAKLIPPAISKLGKIPKKPRPEEPQKPAVDIKKPPVDIKRSPIPEPTTKKPSISIEPRKSGDSARPKTVKTFNSKFRSTGLEEEVKPPPSRAVKKSIMAVEKKPVKFPSLKRPSPPKELLTPPEKKLKSTTVADPVSDETKKNEKSGGIKLIPPRPKPSFLQESDMFMDALTASSKKEPRKRKRRTSSSKEGPETKKESTNMKEDETNKDTTPSSSPIHTAEDSKSPPIVRPLLKFYQDTMETNEDEKEDEESKDKDSSDPKGKSEELVTLTLKDDDDEDESNQKDPTEELNMSSIDEEKDETSDEIKEKDSTGDTPGKYPKGVLVYHKTRKGPKKVVRWKQEKDLENIKYFELDETERVNVSRSFMDMKQIERSNERESFLLARKLPQDDTMEEKTTWQLLIPIELPPSLVEPGVRSREKDVQYAREKVILQALYFNKDSIPDTAAEPDMEIHPMKDPVIIPLDDVTGNPDSVNDFQNTPWPEPKPIIIPQSPPPQFQQSQPSFGPYSNQPFPSSQIFPNQPGVPNNLPIQGGVMVSNTMNNMNAIGGMNNMGSGSGDWRTGDGRIVPVNDMPMQMDTYGPGGPPIGMGMPGPGMPNIGPGPGPGPEMNYNMMGNEEMGPGGPYGPQGYPMGGPPHPAMYPFRGNRGPMRGGRGINQMGPRGSGGGPWFRPNGPHMGGNWQGGGGGGGGNPGGRGGRGWGNQNRGICKHFRGGYCRHADKCPFIHPGVNGPQF